MQKPEGKKAQFEIIHYGEGQIHMKCPICGQELRPGKKDPNYLLCYNCKKKFKTERSQSTEKSGDTVNGRDSSNARNTRNTGNAGNNRNTRT